MTDTSDFVGVLIFVSPVVYARASYSLLANGKHPGVSQPMARFCSECGERLKVRGATPWPSRALCYRCAPAYRRGRFFLAGALALSLAAGFLAGWFLRKPQPFYFIGTPVDSSTYVSSPLEKNREEPGAKAARVQEAVEPAGAICGAPTRSGKRCRRKVRGGGLCWQHRK